MIGCELIGAELVGTVVVDSLVFILLSPDGSGRFFFVEVVPRGVTNVNVRNKFG